eukprot:CAMPEP_0168496492 /NCGR_PEP_ID=MMETSP0228-20121227/72290_1 /TAXON_ID=133427 /ORGANISM="Protoceratium reticulatum, Strain CCCM 535 (=CCMP 1889)" /LENGTH=53 /DNA_ID=CAMNT_0008513363 /DNA_START=45 /DNA_END=203 /DNA_ORIENTATION=-
MQRRGMTAAGRPARLQNGGEAAGAISGILQRRWVTVPPTLSCGAAQWPLDNAA